MNAIIKVKYSTSLDERGYIPVYEYKVNDQCILWDSENGDVFLTGLWKALGYTKSDVIRTMKLNPGLKAKKIRGGLLKIQGTWVPFDQARSLCVQTAWALRYQLTPLFGSEFVFDCLSPNDPNYRTVRLDSLQAVSSSPTSKPSCAENKPCFASLSSMALSHIMNSKEDKYLDDYGTHPMNRYIVDSTLASFVDVDTVKEGPTDVKHPLQEQALELYVVPMNISPSTLSSSTLTRPSPLFHHTDSYFVSSSTGQDKSHHPVPFDLTSFTPLDPPSPLTEHPHEPGQWTVEEMAERIKAAILLQRINYHDNEVFRQVAPSNVVVSGVEFAVIWE